MARLNKYQRSLQLMGLNPNDPRNVRAMQQLRAQTEVVVQGTLEGFDVPELPVKCPKCGRKADWHHVDVDRGRDAEGLPPGEPFDYSQCVCGFSMEYHAPDADGWDDEPRF